MKHINITSYALLGLTIFLTSCLADIRTDYTKKNDLNDSDNKKGRALLQETIEASGAANYLNHETYEMVVSDHWKGAMGHIGNPWPVNEDTMRIKFAVGNFDEQYEVLSGRKQGYIEGQQSWNGYTIDEAGNAHFHKRKKANRAFVMSAYHYFQEIALRLDNAPIVSYAGSKQYQGVDYELVFATWNSMKPNSTFDQYLLYINPDTKLIDHISYTMRENYLPGGRPIYGSISFYDYRPVNGSLVSHRFAVFLNAPKEEKKYIHRAQVKSFAFDTFPKSDLQPNSALTDAGDDKPYLKKPKKHNN